MEKRSKTDRNQNTAVDRISELPESIIHEQIMPRLSRRYRSRTCILSKTWYNLNKTFPALDFDFISFRTRFQKEKLLSSRPELQPDLVKSFKIIMNESIHCFRLKKLSLHSLRVYHNPGSVSDLTSCVELALESRVEKLKLYCPENKKLYCLPDQVYSSTSITTLKLERCILDQPLSLFSSVKKLLLVNCRIKKDSKSIVLKHPDCPALEALTIQNCSGFRSIRIANLVRLHTFVLELSRLTIVDIASPIVPRISFQSYYKGNILSNVDNNGCYCLKVLRLNFKKIMDREFNGLLSKLPLLEHLYLVGCDRLQAIQVSNPRLKTLLISRGSGLKSIDIAAPALKHFMFLGDRWRSNPIKINAEADCLEILVLYSAIVGDKRFHELMAKFPRLQSLWMFRCDELKNIEIPNVRLKRLHIAGCCELKAVKVCSRELFEMHCMGRKDLEISVPDHDKMQANGSLVCDRVVDCDREFWSVSLNDMLTSLLKDKVLAWNVCDSRCLSTYRCF